MSPDTDAPTFSFPEMDPDRRLAELMLYLADKCERDPVFGATKLNKDPGVGRFLRLLRDRSADHWRGVQAPAARPRATPAATGDGCILFSSRRPAGAPRGMMLRAKTRHPRTRRTCYDVRCATLSACWWP